jgi:hypothetical protein
MEAYSKDVNLVFLREIGTPIGKLEKLVLIICHGGIATELDQFIEHIVMQRRPEPLVNQVLKLCPCRRVTVLLKEGEPLCSVTGHVEGGHKYFLGIFSCLDAEELCAPIEPW